MGPIQFVAIGTAFATLTVICSPVSFAEGTDGAPDATPVVMDCSIAAGPHADLANCDMNGADLSGRDLSYADLSGANLSNADLSDAILVGVTATNAQMSRANLIGAVLVAGDFTGASLRGSNLRGANAASAVLTRADLDGAVLSGATLAGAVLTNADLAGAIVDGASLTGADLTRADARGVDFSGADVSGATFVDADLVKADFTSLTLDRQAFRGADLSGATLTRTSLVDADMTGANLTDATLQGADLTRMSQAGVTWWNTTCPDGTVVSGSPCASAREATEAGFMLLAPIPYSFRTGLLVPSTLEFTTTPANVFYTFQPADGDGVDPASAPVFVMLNGGPGAATTANLFANNTAKYTVNIDRQAAGGPGYALNPDSWTSMGNLLYIDPPQTGFSYNIDAAAASSDPERFVEYFLSGNFNPYIDADQVLRVVLAFLDGHPDLQDNPVVLVGESYGGTRVSTMLNMVLFSQEYGSDGRLFRDPGLVTMLSRHFTAIGTTPPLTPQKAARQFGRQVLIQPQLTSYQSDVQTDMYWNTKPSVIDTVAEAAGIKGGFPRKKSDCPWYLKGNLGACALMTYVANWGRDRYNWSKPATWSDDQEAYTSSQFNQLGKLNTILGVDVATIPGFRADDRRGLAYHFLAGIPWLDFDEDAVPPLPGATDGQMASLSAGAEDSDAPIGPYYQGIVGAQVAADSAVADIPPEDSLTHHFGKLGRYDRYYLAWNPDVYLAYSANVLSPEYLLPINQDTSPAYGEMFLRNARYVDTFLTDAEYDLVIYSPALPQALKMHAKTVKDVVRQRLNNANGIFGITYNDGTKVDVYYPYYADSGHAVGASQPAKLRSDIAAWLSCTSDGSCSSND